MQRSRVRRVGALVLGLSLVAAACGDDDDDDGRRRHHRSTGHRPEHQAPPRPQGPPPHPAPPPHRETTGGTGDRRPPPEHRRRRRQSAASRRATSPTAIWPASRAPRRSASSPTDFIARLCEVDPDLEDLNYAAETYDAVDRSSPSRRRVAGDDGIAHASEINGVTRDGEKCTTLRRRAWRSSRPARDIDYDGVSGPLEFAGNGEPLEASYGLLTFGDNNRIDPTPHRVHRRSRGRPRPTSRRSRSRAPARATAC